MQSSCLGIVELKLKNFSLASKVELRGMSVNALAPSSCGSAAMKATPRKSYRLRSWYVSGSQVVFKFRTVLKRRRIESSWPRRIKAVVQADEIIETKDNPSRTEDVIIVGGGLCGVATALALHKVGIRSVVLEQGESLRTAGTSLTVWGNGWRALDVLGVGDDLRGQYAELERVEIMNQEGRVLKGFNLEDLPNGPHEVRNVERKELLKVLAAPLPDGRVQVNSKVVSISQESEGYTDVELEDGTILRTKVLVGCDGLRSVVGKWMQLPEPQFAGQIAIRGVAEYTHNCSKNYMRTLLGRGTRAGYLVSSPTKIYWFIVVSASSRASRITDPAMIKEEALVALKGYPSFIIEAVDNTPLSNLSRSSLWDRWTFPYRSQVLNGVVLAGDAAHPMTPNLGQGGCCALEDAVILGRELHRAFDAGATRASIATSLETFSRRRWERKFPLVVRSNLMGQALQGSFPPVRVLRDILVIPRIPPQMITKHTLFDCGELPVVVA